ncbi:MAG: PilZ domain-containing protein [Candidatus Omnitrophota bacterium]
MPRILKGRDRREFRRIRRNFIVRFRMHAPGAGGKRGKGAWSMAILGDLSVGGAMFKYSRKIDVGSHVDFQIKSPVARPPITCVGKVIRVEDDPFAPIFRVALIFSRMRDSEKEKIDRFVQIFAPV